MRFAPLCLLALLAGTASAGLITIAGSRGSTTLTPEQDFSNRCAAAGVIACYSFDSTLHGNYLNGANGERGFVDNTVYASGGGALRFDLRAGEGSSNISGSWTRTSAPWLLGDGFGQGETFYVQYRIRVSTTIYDNAVEWGSATWKTIIIHENNASCAAIELTTASNETHVSSNTDCGARGLFTNTGDPDEQDTPPLLWQQGWDLTSGPSWTVEPNSTNVAYPDAGFIYPGETWVTTYHKVHIGTLYANPAGQTKDSTVEIWVQKEGEAFWRKVNSIRIALGYNDATDDTYNNLTLTPYMTAIAGTASEDAFMWFDELVISSQPIALPVAL